MKIFRYILSGFTFGVIILHIMNPFLRLDAALSFTITNDNNWGSGFCYEFDFENTSSDPITDWVIGVGVSGGSITSSWGGNFTATGGGDYEITSPGAYIDTVNPGQTHSIGFCGNGGSVTTTPYLISFTNIGGISLQDYTITQEGLQVEVTSGNTWGGGYCRDIIISNVGVDTITSWEIQFELNQTLDNSSSGNFTQVGNIHTITPLAWNTTLNPSDSTNLNFCTTGANVDNNWSIIEPQASMMIYSNQIGTGSIVGDSSYDIPMLWNETFPGYGSGSISGIYIRAQVLPSLNMEISAEEINLGTLLPGVASSGDLNIEIGTNAVNGVTITARSQSGGLTNVADNTIQINDLTADGVAESYTWASTPNATNDSSYTAFAATGLTALEVNEITTEHVVYDTNRPEATDGVDDVTFTVTATAEAETPAGEYEDRVTFTVTGSF